MAPRAIEGTQHAQSTCRTLASPSHLVVLRVVFILDAIRRVRRVDKRLQELRERGHVLCVCCRREAALIVVRGTAREHGSKVCRCPCLLA